MVNYNYVDLVLRISREDYESMDLEAEYELTNVVNAERFDVKLVGWNLWTRTWVAIPP